MIIKQAFCFTPTRKKVALLGLLLVSIFANAVFFWHDQVDQTISAKEMSGAKTFPLISKRLFIEDPNDILVNFVKLRKQLNEYVQTRPEDMGVYFEYLPSGVSIGVNSTDSYIMASLLKVPIVMAVYQKIEKGELTRDTQLTLIERDIDNKFGSLWKEGAGYKISVKEAIRLVLTESDNTAKNALLRTIQVEDLANVFDYLDVPKESEDEGPVVNPKNYSSILRSLYLASYLPHNLSNEILDVMTQSVHTDRLRAGIPNEVPVAHKIGVYERAEDDLNDVFTDCGIVYATRRPYILCIMTRSSLEQAQVNMSQISRMIYDYVSTANK